MPVNPEARLRIENQLRLVAPITSRPMFGGIGIYVEGLFFALIDDDRLYFKVDSTNQGDFEARGMRPFTPFEGSKPMAYYELPADVLENPEELSTWTDKALAVAESARAKRKPKR